MSKISEIDKTTTWEYIINRIPLIQSDYKQSCMKNLLNHYEFGFCNQPAAKNIHHNYRGGLLIHIYEVVDRALFLYDTFNEEYNLNFTEENIYICAVLHDLHKIYSYNICAHTDKITRNKHFKVEHDIWTISEAIKFDLRLTYDEMMGIIQAHGGWSKLNSPTNKLATIIHMADMISSQLIDN